MVCNEAKKNIVSHCYVSLNPYSTGIWSATYCTEDAVAALQGLNPYSTGIWSATTALLVGKKISVTS